MQIKTFFATGALLLSLVAIGSAKSWDIVVDNNTKVGTTALPAGSYTVKLNNDQALFISDSGKKFTVPVKVSNDSAKKFDATEVRTTKDGDTNVIKAIDLGGTTEELKFDE
jgi:hypothetical protein